MKKMSSKGFIIIILILSVLLLIACSYICYDKFYVKDDNNLGSNGDVVNNQSGDSNLNDFYSADNLVKNNYLIKIEDTHSKFEYNDKVLKQIKIENGIVKFLKLKGEKEFEDANGIVGTPKYVYATEYVEIIDPYYVLTEEGDVYVNSPVFDDKIGDYVDGPFKKVNTKKVINIYSISRSVNSPGLDIFTSGIYAEVENGDIFEISGSGMSDKTLREMYPNLG